MKTRCGNVSYGFLIAFLTISTVLVYRPGDASETKGNTALENLPMTLGRWTSKEGRLSDEILATLGARDYLVRQYQSGEMNLTLYITYFDTGSGALTHNPEKCYTAAGWTFLNKKTVQLPGTNQKVLQSTLARDDDRQVVVYWYQVRARILVSKWRQVWGVVWRALAGKQTHSLVVSVSAPVGLSDSEAVGKGLLAFSELAMGALTEEPL